MTPLLYSEDSLVQQTTAEYLERELGWESVCAYSNEDFGPDSMLTRDLLLLKLMNGEIEN